jgi:hypothetical protein
MKFDEKHCWKNSMKNMKDDEGYQRGHLVDKINI